MLGETERDCLERYCALLRRRLGDELVAIRMFGSAARGDMWPAHSPMHPTFFAEERLATPTDERTRDFLAQVERDGVDLWSSR